MMPGMDGMEVLRRVRQSPRTAGVPVVMWSAVADPDFVQYARNKGATDYWLKASFPYTELRQKLARLLPSGC
jgi:CheY-like chemotaxis protein